MILILFGPPGAGKGTQAKLLSTHLTSEHISTGDILRQHVRDRTSLGEKAKSYMDTGELVPDKLVTDMMSDCIQRLDKDKGFILDGYPRTYSQAEALSRLLDGVGRSIDMAVYFQTDKEVIVRRLSGRRICKKCSRIYHIETMPPVKDMVCDDCNSDLYQREDDKESTILNRLAVYLKQSTPVLDYYEKKALLKRINGNLDAQSVFVVLKDTLSHHKEAK